MPKQPKLNDLQLVLLSTASQRKDGNLIPLADSVAESATRATKAIESLIKHGFAAEADVVRNVPSWREEGERRIGVFITADGKAAIGTNDAALGGAEHPSSAPPPTPPAAPARKPGEIRAGTKFPSVTWRRSASPRQSVARTGRVMIRVVDVPR